MAGNRANLNNDVVTTRICLGAEYIYFVNATSLKVAQNFADENVFNELLAATRM